MSKYCPICDEVTNCTDDCKSCLEEENENAFNEAVDFALLPTSEEESTNDGAENA